MTCKGLVLYYSATGNTKYVAELFPKSIYDIFNIKDFDVNQLNKYDIIVLGMSTWERGMPPKAFQNIKDNLLSLEDKDIFLFGSGRIEYEYFCGALDLFEVLLSNRNRVNQIFKFEGFPTDKVIFNINKFVNKINNKLG